ncbi:MAG: hypothetical protein A4S16_03450 [Proteobacteria bacterium SG_bin6]|nr:MAG: hypothetical protein A4S16_03450 [Proteobacteria bacterium SG_bin6]
MTARGGLKRLAEGLERELGPVVFAAAQIIEVEAARSITAGSVSGKGHVPSKPGEPPSNDTGVLARNIETNMVGPVTAEVSSNAPYSQHLEFGTSKMAARPFMAPAVARKRKEVANLLKKGLAAAVRKLGAG